jgi:lipopolysaccharide transport system ATP-binding protein
MTTSNSDLAISIENLGKLYSIGHRRSSGDGMRHAIEGALRDPRTWLRRRRDEKVRQVDFWALRNVSFEIKRGEVVGIIGRNGAGKSTMLKLLSRITVPTEGRIHIHGRVASLLEVGTGFHLELTGRENIFLNGAILGMSRSEIVRKFDEIVEFSEIEEFLDTPVKRYSSGMYVRLAFAVAAHLEPEILIVDEVLAVGDASFQKKCLGKMGTFAESGRTVLFVSHNLEAVRTLCQRGIWMKDGHLHRDGNVEQVIDEYFDSVAENPTFVSSNAECGLTIHKITTLNESGQETAQFQPGEDLTVEITYEAQKRIERPIFAVAINGRTGTCCSANMLLDGHHPDYIEGKGRLLCTFRALPLLPQAYAVRFSIRSAGTNDFIIPVAEVVGFTVVGDLAEFGYKGDYLTWANYSTPVVVPYEWGLPDGTRASVALSRQNILEPERVGR